MQMYNFLCKKKTYAFRMVQITLSNYISFQITQRRCVVWDPSIGVKGAWDAQFCTTVMVGQDSTTCDCYTFGTFTLIAEIVSKPVAEKDPTWLMVWKYIGYILSILVLPVFIGAICFRKYVI